MLFVCFLLATSWATDDDRAFLSSQLDRLGNPEAGGILLAIVNPDGSASYASLRGHSAAIGLNLEDHFVLGVSPSCSRPLLSCHLLIRAGSSWTLLRRDMCRGCRSLKKSLCVTC